MHHQTEKMPHKENPVLLARGERIHEQFMGPADYR